MAIRFEGPEKVLQETAKPPFYVNVAADLAGECTGEAGMVMATDGTGEAGTGEANGQASDQDLGGTPKGPVAIDSPGEAGMGEANGQASSQDSGGVTGEAGTGKEGT